MPFGVFFVGLLYRLTVYQKLPLLNVSEILMGLGSSLEAGAGTGVDADVDIVIELL